MGYSKVRIIVGGLLGMSALGLLSCQAQTQDGALLGVTFITDIQGPVEIQPTEQDDFRDAELGDFLLAETQLRVEDGGQVEVVCNGRPMEPLTAGTHTIGDRCTIPEARSLLPPTRGVSAEVPYITSPRNTSLLTASPLVIFWNPVPGARLYTVTVQGPGVDWQAIAFESSVEYDGEAAFEPEARYRIRVEADTGASSELDEPVGFRLLSEAEQQRVEAQVEEFAAWSLDADAQAVGLALLFKQYEHPDPDLRGEALYASAMDVLQERIEAGSRSSQIYLLQGDIFLAVGLPEWARIRYEGVVSLAREAGQLAQEAKGLARLATVAQGANEWSAAMDYVEAAMEIYQNLGQVSAVAELEARRDDLGR